MSDFIPRLLSDYRTPDFTITHVDLTFELENTQTLVTSCLKLKRLNEQAELLSLVGEHLKLVSIELNDIKLSVNDYKLHETSIEIPTKEEEFTLKIVTEINPQDNTALEGLFKSGDAFCTQCEAEGFRRITYFLDRPDVLAIYTTTIIADTSEYPFLLANGNKTQEGSFDENRNFVKWHDPHPKPSYLFALVAGDFDLLQDSYVTSEGRNVALEIYVDKGNLKKAEHAMTSLKHSMKWDEDTFGLAYDLDIYMIVAVDFFNMGAMENKGLNVFNSKYVLADKASATDTDYFNIEAVIAHEYFHNWTGNRVTCRDWFQLSLKEGLTVFRDQQFSADMHSAAVTRIQNVRTLRSLQFAEDAGPMAHPIRPEKVVEMNNFYTLTVYEKGAEVIRMIHTLLGAEGFRKGMDLYFKRFDGMAVTCDDFVNAMSDASGVDLTQFKHWYSQAGTPELFVSENFDESSKQFELTIRQQLINKSSNEPAPALHIPVHIELLHADKKESHLLELKEYEQTWTFSGIDKKTSVAILGGFTAPVKVNYSQDDSTLMTVMTNADDEFCRWDAGQKLYTNYIKQLVESPNTKLPDNLLAAFKGILNEATDEALIAEQISLPSFHELSDLIEQVDPIALCDALKTIKQYFAFGAKEALESIYNKLTDKVAKGCELTFGQRALKNKCLSYLSISKDFEGAVKSQFNLASNMTDSLSALSCCADQDLNCFEELMSAFEDKWEETTLVMDKWFTIQASLSSPSIFEKLEKLIAHPLFSLKNPNRARSLIGAFSTANPRFFHCDTGKGYQFLSEQLTKLDKINPQVASRLVTPLIQFKEFEPKRQQLMKAELVKLSQLENLSKDLKEKLNAALS